MIDEKVAVLLPSASISAADAASYGQPTNCSMTAFKLFAKNKKELAAISCPAFRTSSAMGIIFRSAVSNEKGSRRL